jgi:prephenate dehydrogenase
MPRIAIIGTGLMGTSLALALRQSELRDLTLVGTDADHHARSGAQKRGAFHRMESRLMPALEGAEIVVLAVPVMAMKDLMRLIGPELPQGCLVTDVGSSKRVVLEWAEQYLPATVDFVGGHPMAGKETAGPEAAEAGLFQGRTYCILPGKNARREAVSTLAALVEAIGAKPLFIGLEEHDSFVAVASHLPFILSATLVGCAAKSANWDDIAQVAATGFRDVTRLASGDPVMHRDICLSNAQPIVAWIDAFIAELSQLRRLLDREGGPDPDAVQTVFQQAFDARARWLSGQVGAQSRQYNSHTEIPTFAEGMGQMFAGRKAIELQKKMLEMLRDPSRKKK